MRGSKMGKVGSLKFDQVGYWSEIKLDIIKDYATAYSTILAARKKPSFHHVYIDAFAGSGIHLSRTSGEFILGSPLNALNVKPPFRDYYLIDLDKEKVAQLRKFAAGHKNVHIYEGDCNKVLLNQVFPKVRYDNYRRGLCLLDPYGLRLEWEVIRVCKSSGALNWLFRIRSDRADSFRS
jgi:three-Cys-motif partner protein